MLDFISQQYSGGMTLPDGTIARNLEAQVQKNKEDIANHYNIDRVLADFGIRVIGQVVSTTELPDPETFDGQFGDAYAVGADAPYRFYIWTRADKDAGRYANYWMDIGPLAIVGPQGPEGKQGPIGETGERGSNWYVGTGIPSNIADSKENDMYLNANGGMVYQYRDSHWYPIRSIRGPQGVQGIQGPEGPQGIQGPKGDIGPTGRPASIYNVVDILEDASNLPSPDDVSANHAYVVKVNNIYDIFVVINDEWHNVGPVGIAQEGTPNNIAYYNDQGILDTTALWNTSVVFRNFKTDGDTGLVNGLLTCNYFGFNNDSTVHDFYNYLIQNDLTDAGSRFMAAHGFSIDTTYKYEYYGVCADPSITDSFFLVGYRENKEDGTYKQASWAYNANTVQGTRRITSRMVKQA